jgi:hypothetical protein
MIRVGSEVKFFWNDTQTNPIESFKLNIYCYENSKLITTLGEFNATNATSPQYWVVDSSILKTQKDCPLNVSSLREEGCVTCVLWREREKEWLRHGFAVLGRGILERLRGFPEIEVIQKGTPPPLYGERGVGSSGTETMNNVNGD